MNLDSNLQNADWVKQTPDRYEDIFGQFDEGDIVDVPSTTMPTDSDRGVISEADGDSEGESA